MQSEPRFQWASFSIAALSALGMATSLLVAAGSLMGALAGALLGLGNDELFTISALGWTGLMVTLLLVPGLWVSMARLFGKPVPNWHLPNSLRYASLGMAAWPILVAAGFFLSRGGAIYWLLLPPVQILVVGLPLWWLVEVGRRNLAPGRTARHWSLFNVAMLGGLPVTFFVEMAVMAAAGIVVVVIVSMQPSLAAELERLANRISAMPMEPEAILRVITPYLRNPAVILLTLAATAGVVPIIEELLKPLAIWLLAGRKLTPAEGFAGGLLCGSAFALMESLGNLATPLGEAWVAVALGRMGTGLLHTLTTALMGWGLASAWTEKRYASLGVIYLVSVGLHALWNTFGVLQGFTAFLEPGSGGLALNLGTIAPLGMGVLVLGMLALLAGANTIIRKGIKVEEA